MSADSPRSSINSLPPVGLAGLFQMKSSGYVPEPNSNGLQFVFDASEFYYRGIETYLQGTATTTVLGLSGVVDNTTGNQWSVPNGTGWIVTGCVATMVAAVTDYRRVRINCGPPGVSAVVAVTEEFNTNPLTVAAVGRGKGTLAWGRPILVPPGYAFNCDTLQVIGAAVACAVNLRLYQFPWS